MTLPRREFLQVLAAASAAGMSLARFAEADAAAAERGLYAAPRFGNVSFLHMTDCHAQLKPVHFREPSVNIGVGAMRGRLPHLVGDRLLKAAGIPSNTAFAHALTSLDFEAAARRYGKVGGFAHIATLVKQLKASRPGALLLDGGDTWQGSATSLWTRGQDMVDAAKLLGVDVMTGHWEFTYGMERVKEVVERDLRGSIEFVAQNIRTTDFDDPVFKPYVAARDQPHPLRGDRPGVPVHADRQPALLRCRLELRHPGREPAEDGGGGSRRRARRWWCCCRTTASTSTSSWRAASAASTPSSVGTPTTASRSPLPVANGGGKTLVTNAGSNGKFLGVMDFEVAGRKVTDYRYRLLPVFANQLTPDPAMEDLIARVRAPYEGVLARGARRHRRRCSTGAATSTAPGTS